LTVVTRAYDGSPTAVNPIRYVYMAYVSIRQHTSAYVSIRQHTCIRGQPPTAVNPIRYVYLAYVSIRQHTSAYVGIRQHTSAYVSIRAYEGSPTAVRKPDPLCNYTPPPPPPPTHTCSRLKSCATTVKLTSLYTSVYVSIHQHPSASVSIPDLDWGPAPRL
jgi:hypothetical protein